MDRQIDMQIDRYADRQKGRQINRQRDRQVDSLMWLLLLVMAITVSRCNWFGRATHRGLYRQIYRQVDRPFHFVLVGSVLFMLIALHRELEGEGRRRGSARGRSGRERIQTVQTISRMSKDTQVKRNRNDEQNRFVILLVLQVVCSNFTTT